MTNQRITKFSKELLRYLVLTNVMDQPEKGPYSSMRLVQ